MRLGTACDTVRAEAAAGRARRLRRRSHRHSRSPGPRRVAVWRSRRKQAGRGIKTHQGAGGNNCARRGCACSRPALRGPRRCVQAKRAHAPAMRPGSAISRGGRGAASASCVQRRNGRRQNRSADAHRRVRTPSAKSRIATSSRPARMWPWPARTSPACSPQVARMRKSRRDVCHRQCTSPPASARALAMEPVRLAPRMPGRFVVAADLIEKSHARGRANVPAPRTTGESRAAGRARCVLRCRGWLCSTTCASASRARNAGHRCPRQLIEEVRRQCLVGLVKAGSFAPNGRRRYQCEAWRVDRETGVPEHRLQCAAVRPRPRRSATAPRRRPSPAPFMSGCTNTGSARQPCGVRGIAGLALARRRSHWPAGGNTSNRRRYWLPSTMARSARASHCASSGGRRCPARCSRSGTTTWWRGHRLSRS